TCNETVLPVPVAPVTKPCRLASSSVSQADCSPLPIKRELSLSLVVVSVVVAIASPLCVLGVADAHLPSYCILQPGGNWSTRFCRTARQLFATSRNPYRVRVLKEHR